jgi:hypothetical protein
VDIFPGQDEPIEGVRLTGSFSFDQDLYRLATKMTASVLVAFDQQLLVTTSGIPPYLRGNGAWPTAPAYCDISPILGLRLPLAHAVYVELGQASYAIVLLFGFLKLFVPLPASSAGAGFLAVLDPITGQECFSNVKPVGARSIPAYIQPREAMIHLREMNANLTREAILRGAKYPPQLETSELDLGPSQVSSWTDTTTRFMFTAPSEREPEE